MYLELETERLLIRPIRLDDAGFILKLVNSQGWLQFIGDRKIKTDADAAAYIQKILDHPHYYYSVYQLNNTNKPIGLVTFLKRDHLDAPDIGFAMLPEYEGKSYAYEVSIRYLQEILKLKTYTTILAITRFDNQKSIRLLKKLGMYFKEQYENNEELIHVYTMKGSE
ncbi:MAG: GNAT family N-acetyltransferase [Aquimarina sp.]|nr:GNAT family N-acetyltransferase [Aquimarina sp.]